MRKRRRTKQVQKHKSAENEEVFPGVDQAQEEETYQNEVDPEGYYRYMDREDWKYYQWWLAAAARN